MRDKPDSEGESVAGYAGRVANIADKLLEDIVSGEKRFDLIGLNEGYSGRKSGALGWAPVYRLEKIPCEITGTELNTAECLAAQLENNPKGPDSIAVQHGEIGVVANSARFGQADSEVLKRNLGKSWFGTVKREVVGLRLRLKETGHVLPFYSTHISAGTANMNRTAQLEDLVSAVREWWKPGDLTPVIVGDFNSHDFEDKHWAILQEHFCEVGKVFGVGAIEHVWIGRKTSFTHASGTLLPIRYERILTNDKGVTMSDHNTPYVELSIVGDRPHATERQ